MHRLFTALICVCFAATSIAQKVNPWSDLLRAISYAEIAKASFEKGCNTEEIKQTFPYPIICPKLSHMPNSVIEQAAEPFLREYVSETIAIEAKEFWLTQKGEALNKKIIAEIKSGRFNQLTAADLKEMEIANKTRYGKALLAFSKDKVFGNSTCSTVSL